ncbi:MAG: xylosidase/arabinosidase [Herbinix sp.]|jgi:hypothetical protein|nr:xylosidase/arabinosidase [Herbinix sp.]
MTNMTAIKPHQTERNNLIGKTVAGYQAWFRASRDLDQGWHHWSPGRAPEPGAVHFEVFPDLSEYPEGVMYDTRLGKYLDGTPVRVYQAHEPEVIDVHFSWMQKYGVDGVGVQRFYTTTSIEEQPEPHHLTAVKNAAEKYERIFYVMYDMSGCGRDDMKVVTRIQGDVIHNVENKGLTASEAYAHANGKPVICIWGLAGTEPGRYPISAAAIELIKWLKERGYFIIGGFPDNNWTKVTDEYAEVYRLVDMASPWTPGRYRMESVEQWLTTNIKIDQEYCEKHGIIYQPVMFPGFAWCNFNTGNPNAIPREAGNFLWKQAKLYGEAGVRNAYFAMFDEYDEGTAIMKAASDSFMLPAGSQYFQTLAVDGYWLSSDFYLRLAGYITSYLRQEAEITEEVPVEHSNGPVFWRNGFEKRLASVRLTKNENRIPILANIDICDNGAAIYYQNNIQLEAAAVVEGAAGDICYSGQNAFAFSGIAMTKVCCEIFYKIANAKIKVDRPMTIRYMLKAMDSSGCFVGVDLLFEDGTKFSDISPEVLDTHGEIGKWCQVSYDISTATGKTIKAILLAYSRVGEGFYSAYVDDIEIFEHN